MTRKLINDLLKVHEQKFPVLPEVQGRSLDPWPFLILINCSPRLA